MPIAFDAFAHNHSESDATTLGWDHTCSGSNLALIVSMFGEDAASADNTITGVTYDGVALTKGFVDNFKTTANLDNTDMWYLLSPANGTKSIVATYAGSCTVRGGVSASFTGVLLFEGVSTATGTGDTPSVSRTTTANNAWVIDSLGVNITSTATPGAGQTATQNDDTGTQAHHGQSYEGPKTPAGAVTMSYTGGGPADTWAIIAGSFSPVDAGTAATTPTLLTLGVG